MNLFFRIFRAFKNRFFIEAQESLFLSKLSRTVNTSPGKSPEGKSDKGCFFVEAIGVNQIMCLNQALFAKSGEQEGLSPIVIMNRYVRKNKKVFTALGIDDIKFVGVGVTIFDRLKACWWAQKAYRTLKTPSDLLNFTHDGITMGSFIYSSYLFKYMTGTVSTIDSDIRKYLRYCYLHYLYYRRLFDKYDPAFVVLTNNTYIECGTLFQMAVNRGIPAYVAVWPASNKVSIKKYTKSENLDDLCVVNPTKKEWDSITGNADPAWLEAGKDRMKRRFNGEDRSFGGADTAVGRPWLENKAVCDMLKIDADRKIALVCAHVMWDDPVIYSALYRDYYWWWVETAKLINEIEDVTWILKAHPGEMDTLGRKSNQVPIRSLDALKSIPLKPHVRLLDSGLKFNNYSLMQIVDAVVTVRGSVGLEYACAGIPVITAGKGPYSHAGFTTNCDSIDDYKNALKNVVHIERLSQDKINKALIFSYFYMDGGTGFEVKGTPAEFDITKLEENFWSEFVHDESWKKIARQMAAHSDCRNIH